MYNKKDKVKVDNAKLYTSFCSNESNTVINGYYFIYDERIKNNRIRITDTIERVDIPCSMTGWVDLSCIEKVE